MKKLSIFFFVLFTAVCVKGQTLILAKDAAQNVGKNVTICDSVYSTKSFEKLSLINVGGIYPKELVTLVVNKENISKFSADPASMYLGNNICVTGIISEFKGKYQIMVTDPKQILVK